MCYRLFSCALPLLGGWGQQLLPFAQPRPDPEEDHQVEADDGQGRDNQGWGAGVVEVLAVRVNDFCDFERRDAQAKDRNPAEDFSYLGQ